MGAGSAALPLAEPEGEVHRAPSSPRNPPPSWHSSAVSEFRPPFCVPSVLSRLPAGTACVSSARPRILRVSPPYTPIMSLFVPPLSVPTPLPVPTAHPPHVPYPYAMSPSCIPSPLPPPCPLSVPRLLVCPISSPHVPGPPHVPSCVPLCIFQERAPTTHWGQMDVAPRATPVPFEHVVPKQQQCPLWWLRVTLSHHGRGSVIRVDNDL